MSAKTVAEKLQIKRNTTVWSSHVDRISLVGTLPDGVEVVETLAEASTALVFGDDERAIREMLTAHAGSLETPKAFWVAYPKANRTNINRDSLWPILTEYGMRPIAQVAVDDIWSALRFRPLKDGEEPFTGGRSSVSETALTGCRFLLPSNDYLMKTGQTERDAVGEERQRVKTQPG